MEGQKEPTQNEEEFEPFLLMEEIVDKLKFLDYEALFTRTKGHKPLSRSYFAMKLPNSNEQSVYFSSLSVWLLTICGGSLSGDKKYEDPLSFATTLLTEMKSVGINCEIPPNKLRTGFGDSVISVLSKLVDKAIEKKKLTFKKMRIDNEKSSNSTENIVEIEEEAPDTINVEIQYDDEGKGSKTENANEVSDVVSEILTSDIPTDEWQRELERVAGKLKIDYANNSSFSSSEWRSHVDSIKTNEENFAKSIPDSRSILENLSGDIDQSLEKISKKENILSKNFTNIIADYKGRQKETTNQYEEYNFLREKVQSLSRDYEDLEEKIAENNNKFENVSKSVSDTSSVTNLKNGMQKLHSESLSIDLKIHILNHSILKYRQYSLQNHPVTSDGLDTSMFDELL